MDIQGITAEKIEFYNNDSSDIIGRDSTKLKVWYLVSVILVFIGVVTAYIFVKCPDTIISQAEINCDKPSINVFAPTSGIVVQVSVQDGEIVKKGDTVVIIKSLADTISIPIISPEEGVVNYMELHAIRQFVPAGTLLFNVNDAYIESYHGRALLSASDVSRVQEGNSCRISLEKYNDIDYGLVEGVITKVNKMPLSNGFYLVNFELPEGLKTNTGCQLHDDWYLTGTITIIVNDRSLLDLVIQPLKKILDKQ